MANLGMRVIADMYVNGVHRKQVFRNVTEIHYNYRRTLNLSHDRNGEVMVAFESDIHGTGSTYGLQPNNFIYVVEFEAVLETEKAEEF